MLGVDLSVLWLISWLLKVSRLLLVSVSRDRVILGEQVFKGFVEVQ